MVTLEKYGNNVNRPTCKIFCSSYDAKPLRVIEGHTIANGSVLTETDTGKKYIYDEENAEWNVETTTATITDAQHTAMMNEIFGEGNWEDE